MLRLLPLIGLLASPAQAAEFLTPEQFEAYAQGKTLYFAQQGQPYGVEQYLPGQRSVWQYADGTCTTGEYFARQDMICFVYDGDTEEQCWHFLQKGDSFAARALGREPEADLDVIWRDEQPISCRAPDVGA